MNFKAIILAAGKGTRMKSKHPKVVHKVCGKEMVNHVIDVSKKSGVEDVVVILGHGSETVKTQIPQDSMIAMQTEQLGTGHAVKMAKEYINDNDTIVVLCGDTPLVKEETLKRLFDYHIENQYHATVLTTKVENPTGYGRIIRDENEDLLKIVEQKDANEEEKKAKEINSGIYCFDGKSLRKSLDLLDNNNAQGEYYLTDTIKIMRDKGQKVGAYNGSTIEELMGVNSRVELSKAEEIMRRRINESHMVNGVTIIDINSTYIESDVEIGNDTIVYPGAMLKGNTKIGSSCVIGMNSSITNSTIGDYTEVESSTIIDSTVGENTTVGPYAYLRPKSNIGNNVKIGDFVEVKNATIEDNSKASHLSYIGDAHVGKNVNIGCGVVFVNYDGKNKFKSVVKDGAFIGSNSNLVAPVTVEEKGYIATGSTITDDVPQGSLAIARQRQVVKEGWVEKKDSKDNK
ncbi:bifunctional UDP-N-acetylglucosamine diphosphorylase/glucosamine-1-phosphate N-acetyltransferase GlmU [Clostridium sp. CCUG 7971]|uniref:bifunctional UDP-N-acetylglucosamine diphosphorylase/glucosamine-1-phosphate N-acetyltransferase GlmU n=1 Tax=Clostridium sp. CCUG 7971 TaxID=2811414 RepID=UPI001ABAC7C8|nr:bifunctional UDP-N-acetylglucosamine diphosphorylase/glucosamine-1-phosphate N-acetyltransferase GlmU [Clostridium sp. CCUG 7971]MBO3444084.1 bifunctional UDP-N-acetylglucosamine diphosphorylase/glucosamine-1-phosphate N-acetyltransferase GlmU [Clostridium sp. CCUG 7971]